MLTVGIIPARLNSTRLPGKLLLSETGRPLIQHTWEAALQARFLDKIVVAVDSKEVAEAVAEFGGWFELTGEHASGTDRVAEVTRRCFGHADIVVNIQGDEPEIVPQYIDAVVEALIANPDWQISTLVSPITNSEQLSSPHIVKAVCTENCRALYFSRAPVPFVRDHTVDDVFNHGFFPWKHHIGLYAYRSEFLMELTKRPPSPLEQFEKLEQLRALEAGGAIGVVEVPWSTPGIDTIEEYSQFVARYHAARSQTVIEG